MKLSSEVDSAEVLQATGEQMSPPSLARGKSGMGSIVVDMGNRGEVDLRVGDDVYSPNKKAMRPEPVLRIHLIPLMLILVFFVLWARSTEVDPNRGATPEIIVMKMATPNQFAKSEHLNVSNDEISQRGTRTGPDHQHSSHAEDTSHSISTNGLSKKTYMRGNTR